ncbi:MAG: PEGA domain-containing protein [Polyangiaceae bacterium]
MSLSLSRLALAQSAEPALAPSASEAKGSSLPLAESLQGDAKRDYELGRLLYDNGDFAGALLRFESALRASGEPRLLWNAAVCEKALRHYAKAAAKMRQFLAANPAGMTDATRTSAREFEAAAESLTAPLEVTSNVPGATLYVDQDHLGPLPLAGPARIDWGAHQILVKMPGYVEYAQTVSVTGSAVVRVAAVLRPTVYAGRIIVRAGPSHAIFVDGRRTGWGTWEGVLISGHHSLRVAGEGFIPLERQITVMDGQTQGFDITLERAERFRMPKWVWLVGGGVLAAGAATASYFVFKPEPGRAATPGSLGTVRLELH